MKTLSVIACAALAASALTASADRFTLSEPVRIEDTSLRDSEYAAWSFGGGPLLQVGYLMGSEAVAYNAVSLLRFDLSGVACKQIASAKLRLYKPRDYVQRSDIRIAVHEVSAANSGWREGSAEAIEDTESCSWSRLRSGTSWSGARGCSREGADYLAPALDAQVAQRDSGHWIEFTLPPNLAQRWLDKPETNAGLILRPAEPVTEWGCHAFFHSSEHWSGKGPQLVIEGAPGPARDAATERKKRVFALPSVGPKLEKWRASSERLARFARDMGATTDQARVLCMIDTTVRRELIINLYGMPLAIAMPKLADAVKRNDEKACRELLHEVRKANLAYEYVHDTQWYTAGPLADVFSNRQLGILYGKCLFGRQEQRAIEEGRVIWKPETGEAMEKGVRATVDYVARKLELTPEQRRAIEPELSVLRRTEQHHMAAFRSDFDKLKALAAAGADGPEVFELVRSTFFNHEAFLYYQSIYVAPRWKLLLENAPVVPFARWITEVRGPKYVKSELEKQLRQISEFE